MRPLLAFILLSAWAVAWADGVPLLTPGPALSSTDAARVAAKVPGKHTAATVNAYAIDSNVITATLGGKAYRFVGTKRTVKDTVTKTDDGEVWEGTAPDGSARITRTRFGVAGEFFVDRKRFMLVRDGAAAVLVEVAPPAARTNGVYDMPSPELIESIRKKDEERRKAGSKP